MRKSSEMSSRKDRNTTPGTKRGFVFYAGFVLLLFLFLLAAFIIPRMSRSQDMIQIGNARLPVTAFAGVVSSLTNICVIFLVVIYKKQGFITSLVLLLVQFPSILYNTFVRQNLAGVPGFFSNLLILITIIVIRNIDRKVEVLRDAEVNHLKEQQKLSRTLFEQTAKALVTAIDAKDVYSHGHSMRVAEYSRRLAGMMGKNEEECEQIYYAGLLHDVGKIGIADSIISKKDNLTPEEYEEIKQHPVMGSQILSTITGHPYISIAARYHHEWYDGSGYPEGLKGKDIPEIARIISVADAYDTMSSNRYYRNAIPQQLIREEIVKGAGTQFDPELALLMQRLIDLDTEYQMKEYAAKREIDGNNELRCGEYRDRISDSVVVTPFPTKIRLNCSREDMNARQPTIVLFDSLDGCVYTDEKEIAKLHYFEFCEIGFDGKITGSGVRKTKTEILPHGTEQKQEQKNGTEYELNLVKRKDHVQIRIDDGTKTVTVTVALPDGTRFAYAVLTGERCTFRNIHISRAEEMVPENYIPRIAEEISFIDGPEGDIPSLQVDSFRTASTEGIPVTDGLKITFHSKSLPTAQLIWHCPYVVLFNSGDGKINGKDYREYALIRLDGENWEGSGLSENELTVERTKEFGSWDNWKEANRKGIDCTVTFLRKGNTVITETENLGIRMRNVTTANDRPAEIYAALSGDQVVLTNIRTGR